MVDVLDIVSLRRDRPDLGLTKGQPGTVLLVHVDGALEIEFADSDGRAIAQPVLSPEEVVGVQISDDRHLSFLIFRTSVGDYSWRLTAPSGELLATGEPVATKAECLRIIRILTRSVGDAPILDQTAA